LLQYQPNQPQVVGGLLVALLILSACARRDAQQWNRQMQHGWLSASAWPVSARTAALRRSVLYRCVLRLAGFWLMLGLLQQLRTPAAPALLWSGLLALSVLAIPAALLWTLHDVANFKAPRATATPAIAPVPGGSSGLLLLRHAWRTPPLQSQRLQATLGLLVLPGELSGIKALAVIFVLLALLWGGRCFRHYRESCFAATRWLAATRLPSTRLAAALLPPLLWRLAWLTALMLWACAAAGAPLPWLALSSAVLIALLTLNMALVLVHRQQPRQYRVAASTQTLLLLLLAQSVAPLSAVLWLLLAVRAWRIIRTPIGTASL
jgi:hypothetical protein